MIPPPKPSAPPPVISLTETGFQPLTISPWQLLAVFFQVGEIFGDAFAALKETPTTTPPEGYFTPPSHQPFTP